MMSMFFLSRDGESWKSFTLCWAGSAAAAAAAAAPQLQLLAGAVAPAVMKRYTQATHEDQKQKVRQ